MHFTGPESRFGRAASIRVQTDDGSDVERRVNQPVRTRWYRAGTAGPFPFGALRQATGPAGNIRHGLPVLAARL
jgi:hypothetical protein